MPDSCLDCGRRADCVFSDLAPQALAAFDGIKSVQTFPKGAVLFREGQAAQSVFLLCQGRIRLSVSSGVENRLLLRVADPGEALGLSAALASRKYEATAEAMDTVSVAFIHRKELVHFLRQHCDVCMQVVHQLSDDLHVAYSRVRRVGLTRSRRPASVQVH